MQNVAIPGVPGQPPYAIATADFTVPAIGSTVSVSVNSTLPFANGQNVFVGNYLSGGGNFQIAQIVDLNTLILTFLGYPNDVQVGTVFVANSLAVGGTGNLSAAETFTGQTYATVTTPFIVPALSLSVNVAVSSSANFVAGQNVFVQGGYNFMVLSVNNPASITLQSLQLSGDSAPGSTVPIGALILPAVGNATSLGGIPSVSIVSGVPTFANGFASTRNRLGGPFFFKLSGSGVPWVNGNPYSIEVYADLGDSSGSIVFKNGQYLQAVSGTVSCYTVRLQPGETISINYGYGVTPTMSFSPL